MINTSLPLLATYCYELKHFWFGLFFSTVLSFVFWEILVTGKECVQTVGGCYKIYHRVMTGLDWEAEILKSYITLILYEQWSDFTRLLSRDENESLDPSTTLWLRLAQQKLLPYGSQTLKTQLSWAPNCLLGPNLKHNSRLFHSLMCLLTQASTNHTNWTLHY